jgi:hypothetical protein
MSTRYAESNEESSKELFNKRAYYRGQVKQVNNLSNIVDFNYGEKFWYGRVNQFWMPIRFKNGQFLKLKNFNKTINRTEGISGVNFVVDAFNAMATQFKKCAMAGKISSNQSFLSELTVFKGYEDPLRKYSEFLDFQNAALSRTFNNDGIKFEYFHEFVDALLLKLTKVVGAYPYTMPAYVKSKFCPITCSGLAIEIADLDPANDQEKISEFINNVNWDFYVNTCNDYGFMVDKFIPWRIVADIGAQQLLDNYARPYMISTTGAVIGLGYDLTHITYYRKFKFYLLNLYNRLKLRNYMVSEACPSGATITKIVTPVNYSIQKLTADYDEEYFLKLYFKIRFMEEQSHFEVHEQERLVDDTLELYQSGGLARALYDFERILNKPFDYRGSLSYYVKHMEARRAAGEF